MQALLRTLVRFNSLSVTRYTRFSTQQQTANPEILEEVKAKVYQVLKSAAKCKTDKLQDKATFEELGFDSLDSVEMVVALEENFGFDVSNEEAERIQTVQDAVSIFYKYVVQRLNQEGVVESKK